MEDFEDDCSPSDPEDFRLLQPLSSWASISLISSIVTVGLLSGQLFKKSDSFRAIWERLLHVRILKSIVSCIGAPLVGLVWCAQAFGGIHLVSRCCPPYLVRAEATGATEALLLWTPQWPYNPFHNECYICAWSSISATRGDAAVWSEKLVTENLWDGEDLRWVTLVDGLPEQSSIRIRVCAVNELGRSGWSSVEVTTYAKAHCTEHQHCQVGQLPKVLFCVRCRSERPERRPMRYANVASRPLFEPNCPHGPFCDWCQRRISAGTLPSCTCRALIRSWREA